MELDWYFTDMLEMRHHCWCGILWVFKRLLVSPRGRQGSPHQSAWFLMVNIKANRVAIVSFVITKIFTLASIGQSQFNFFWMTLFWSVLVLFITSFSCSIFVQFHAFVVLFDSVLFVRFGSLVQYSNYSEYFLSWPCKCIPGISIPLYTNQQAVNKHTADITIFCFSILSERPITIIDKEGYLEPISPYGLSRRRDIKFCKLSMNGFGTLSLLRFHLNIPCKNMIFGTLI